MAERKQSLIEFQAQLAERLRAATRTPLASGLGFAAGGRLWLTDLFEMGEVVTDAVIVPVPWAKPWFLGLANVRGVIYGCTDLAAFMGLAAEGGEGTLLLAHPRLEINAALRIDRTLGLRSPARMTREDVPPDAPPWVSAQWRDAQGQVWTQLSLERLVTSQPFLDAGLARGDHVGAAGGGLHADKPSPAAT